MATKNNSSTPTQEVNTSETVPDAQKKLGPAAQMLLRYVEKNDLKQHVFSIHSQHGDDTIVLSRDIASKAFTLLKTDPTSKMEMMIDLTAVDLFPSLPRFEVVYHLKSLSFGYRLRIKIPLDEEDTCLPSVINIWQAADWYERECWEMYGIIFKGHPNLKPLLLYEGFKGWPLRKDYEKGLSQPLVEMRPVRERYDYQERFQPVKDSITGP